MAGPCSGAKAVAGPGAEVPAEPNSPHGFCPQCPAASARTAGKAAATGSIKLKCFLFQTIKRHHDTRGTKCLEETLCSLLPTPLPTPAAWRDGVGHRAGPHARGRTGLPQAPCFRVPLPPGQGRPQCRASAGPALPATNQGRYGQGASMEAAGDGQHTCPQTRLQVGTRDEGACTGNPTISKPVWRLQSREGQGGQGSVLLLPVATASHSRHERLHPRHSPLGHDIQILSTARTEKSPGTSAGCQRMPLRHQGALPPQGAGKQRERTPGGTQPPRARCSSVRCGHPGTAHLASGTSSRDA